MEDIIRESFSEEDTYNIGREFGEAAEKGDVYCFYGDLGVGKTIFSKGFAKGLGINEVVNSPTFTIVQEYKEGRIPLYHFDLYRIADISELDEIGYEEYFYSEGTCLVEWGNLYPEIFPENTIKIEISKDLSKGFDYRRVTIEKQQKED